MENSGKPWSFQEENQLKQLYSEGMNIIEISKIHKRYPGGISSRLKSLGIIRETRDANGYDDYLKSDLYKEACNNAKIKKNNNTNTELKNVIDCLTELKYIIYEVKNELKETKLEVKELKLVIKELMK